MPDKLTPSSRDLVQTFFKRFVFPRFRWDANELVSLESVDILDALAFWWEDMDGVKGQGGSQLSLGTNSYVTLTLTADSRIGDRGLSRERK